MFEKEIFSFIPESFMVLAQTIMSILKTFRRRHDRVIVRDARISKLKRDKL